MQYTSDPKIPWLISGSYSAAMDEDFRRMQWLGTKVQPIPTAATSLSAINRIGNAPPLPPPRRKWPCESTDEF